MLSSDLGRGAAGHCGKERCHRPQGYPGDTPGTQRKAQTQEELLRNEATPTALGFGMGKHFRCVHRHDVCCLAASHMDMVSHASLCSYTFVFVLFSRCTYYLLRCSVEDKGGRGHRKEDTGQLSLLCLGNRDILMVCFVQLTQSRILWERMS